MADASLAGAIAAPYALLDAAFAPYALAAAAPGAAAATAPVQLAGAWVRSVKAQFGALLATEQALAQVPLLTADALRRGAIAPNSLVRVVGQVQDAFDVELYPAFVPVAASAASPTGGLTYCAFRDTLSGAAELPSDASLARSLMSRHTLYVVPVPGETDWARAQRLSQHEAAVRATSGAAAHEAIGGAGGAVAPQHGVKRGRGGDDEAPAQPDDAGAAAAAAGAGAAPALAPLPPLFHAQQLALDKPLVSDAHGDPPVLLRLYGGDADPAAQRSAGRQSHAAGPRAVGLHPKINELIECVGIYTLDPQAPRLDGGRGGGGAGASTRRPRRAHGSDAARAATAGGGMELDGEEEEAEEGGDAGGEGDDAEEDEEEEGGGADRPRLPPSLVPRVHALLLRRLAPAFPLLQPHLRPPVEGASGAFALQPAGLDDAGGDGDAAAASGAPPRERGAAMLAAATAAGGSGSSSAPPQPSAGAGAAAVAPAAPPLPLTDSAVLRACALDALPPLLASLAGGGGGDEAASGPAAADAPAARLARARGRLHAHLSALLGGDALAGEYLLLHLLSGVTARQGERLADSASGGLVLGKLSLCLSGFPDATELRDGSVVPVQATIATPTHEGGGVGGAASGGDAADAAAAAAPQPTYTPVLPLAAGASPCGRVLAAALSALLPRVALLPLRIDNLNTLRAAPSKGLAQPKLRAGLLQLAGGAQVLLDETVLTSGTLGPLGVAALGALRSVARSATLPYSFPFCELLWPADVRLLVLAHRRPLVSSCDVTLQLLPRASAAVAAAAGAAAGPHGLDGGTPPALLLPPPQQQQCRALVNVLGSLPFSLSPRMSETIQDDWVEARRRAAAASGGGDGSGAPAAAVTTEDLHRWLTLARLAALSFGEQELTPARWAWVRALEAARAERSAELSAGSPAVLPVA